MKNFVFISPNFPTNYWQFCRELKNNGLNVLGVGDQPYDELTQDQKDSLTEYYKVGSLEDYDEVYRAVAFFTFKYGRIDFVESNNEYWLEQDARLRTDFNIKTGFQTKDMPRIKYKSKMKKYYEKAGIPTARYHIVDTVPKCLKFIEEVSYPVIVKPDNGVGASHTYKISSEEELEEFFKTKDADVSYIMEEFIDGEICSYDAIINSKGEPLFEAGNCTVVSIMDVVNNESSSLFYIVKDLPEDTRAFGHATVKSFGVKSRFVHLEFFRLRRDHKGLGKKGDLMALEVNMRPSGGNTPEMLNFARETDVYKIWADMIAFDSTEKPIGAHHYCAFAGVHDSQALKNTPDDVRAKYAANLKMDSRLPEALSGAMGNQMYLATFEALEDVKDFYTFVTTPAE